MDALHAIRNLEEYIKTLNKKKLCSSYGYEGSYIGANERIESAKAQIELYRQGKGRLQISK